MKKALVIINEQHSLLPYLAPCVDVDDEYALSPYADPYEDVV